MFNFGNKSKSPEQQAEEFLANATPEQLTQLDTIIKGMAAGKQPPFPLNIIDGKGTDPAADDFQDQPAPMAKANAPEPKPKAAPDFDDFENEDDFGGNFGDPENGEDDPEGGDPEGVTAGSPQGAPGGKMAKAVDATQAVAMMLQGQQEIAGELHRQADVISTQQEQIQAQNDLILAQGDLIKSYTSGVNNLLARVEKGMTEQSEQNSAIIKAMGDVEENSQFIKALRQSPAGHPTNRSLPAGTQLPPDGTFIKAVQGTEPLTGALAGTSYSTPSDDETTPTRFGMTQRNFMKGMRACSTDEMARAGVSLDQFYSIQSGGISFDQVPENLFGIAANKLGVALQK